MKVDPLDVVLVYLVTPPALYHDRRYAKEVGYESDLPEPY